MIVDDNRQVLEQLNLLLTNAGYHVGFIPRADFMFERLAKEPFDLLLLDINLPGKSGIERLQEIKRHPLHQDLPVVMITGEDERDTLARCFELGASDYIRKPINEVALLSRIRSAITSRRYVEQRLRLESQKALQSKLRMLSGQMNPHFIFNALASVQAYVMTNDNEKAIAYLSEFAGLMRRNLENSMRPFISMSEELDFITTYLELERMRFKGSFAYEIRLYVSDPEELMIPPMLLQPYLENAIVHGLRRSAQPGLLVLEVSENEDCIRCIITDNGIGRAAAGRLYPGAHQSIAMSNIEARLEILNMDERSSGFNVTVDDLVTGGKAAGTKVTICLPKDLH